MNTSPEFKTALDRFMAVAQSVGDTLDRGPRQERDILTIEPCRRYVRGLL
jgi:hypothetical protein